ncbi:MAG: hypothetical protein WA633_23855 [Stellaceae bacterium]
MWVTCKGPRTVATAFAGGRALWRAADRPQRQSPDVRGGVEFLFKAFVGKPFSHLGKYYTIPPEVPYRGYTLKEITLVRRRSNTGG